MPDVVKGEYYCTFLAKNSSKVRNSDNCRCYWSDLYYYLRDLVSKDIVVGNRVLFHPNITLDHKKYIQWGDRVQLAVGGCLFLGPFNFESADKSNWTRNIVPYSLLHQLPEICRRRNILPLTVGGQR